MRPPSRYADGGLVSPNLNVRPKKDVPPLAVLGPCRAVVLRTYFPDSESSLRGRGVECDVIFYGTEHRPAVRVPVAQTGGARNQCLWLPSPTTHNLRTGEAINWTTEIDTKKALQDIQDWSELSGDHVIVEFLGGVATDPVITGSLPHPRAAEFVASKEMAPIPASGVHPASPDGYVRYLAHMGAIAMIDRFGNVVVNTTGAPTDNAGKAITPPGSEAKASTFVNLPSGARFDMTLNGALIISAVHGETSTVNLGDHSTLKRVARLGDKVRITVGLHAFTDTNGDFSPIAPTTIEGEIIEGSDTVWAGD